MRYIDDFITALDESTLERNKEIMQVQTGLRYILDCLEETKINNNKIFFIGNGGSAAIASHMTADYMKNGGIITCSLQEGPMLTCLANDFSYEDVYAKQINSLGLKGDILIAISSSGNSKNIINAIMQARQIDMTVITFSGFDKNNAISKMGDINIHVPVYKYGMVESIHELLLQEIIDLYIERICNVS